MHLTAWIVGTVVSATVVGGIIFYRKRKKSLDEFFGQIYLDSKQIPKQKKNSFLLLMFKESVSASKKKGDMSSFANKIQNPKYLNVQLIQMATILKDPSKVKDKKMKKALTLYDSYLKWEKIKIAESKKIG